MPNRTALLALFALCLLPAGLGAATLTVWQDYDFRGDSDVFDTAMSRLDDAGWNDRISSFRVDSGSWELCRDWDFRGCRTVVQGEKVARLDDGWNDVISSVRPVSGTATASNPQVIAERLYRALLGRDADPDGLRNAAIKIQAGQLAELVRGMTQSAEFRSVTQNRPSSEILDQIYRGLLGRPADAAARTAYVGRLERGEVERVVLDIVASEEFASAGGGSGLGTTIDRTATGQNIEVQAKGTGVVIWGAKGQHETISMAKVVAGRDGRIHISFTGSSHQSLDGTWTRDPNGNIRIDAIELPTKPAIEVDGGVQLDHDQLARIDVTAGAQGTRDRVLYSFVAEDYELPREETLCQQAIRAKLGAKGSNAVFLAPARSRVTYNRQELRGEVVILSDNTSTEYRCEFDSGRGQVVGVSVRGQ